MQNNKIFEWDPIKNVENICKHGVSFEVACLAFLDRHRILTRDLEHSLYEERWFCLGKVGRDLLTVHFVFRGEKIRIYGAGYWRRGKRRYEQENYRN
jgi:uncharacterized DUF497 family protein